MPRCGVTSPRVCGAVLPALPGLRSLVVLNPPMPALGRHAPLRKGQGTRRLPGLRVPGRPNGTPDPNGRRHRRIRGGLTVEVDVTPLIADATNRTSPA